MTAAVIDDAHDCFVGRTGQRDHHLGDALLVDDALELVRRDSAGYRTKVEAAKSSMTEMPEAVKSLDRSSSALAALGSRYMPRSPRMDANTSDSTICSGRYTSCST